MTSLPSDERPNKRVRECEGDGEREEMLVREYKRLEHDHGRLLGEYAELAKVAKKNDDAFMAAAGHLCKSAERVAELEKENKELVIDVARRISDAKAAMFSRDAVSASVEAEALVKAMTAMNADCLEKQQVIDYVREARADFALAFTEVRKKALAIKDPTPEALCAISEEYTATITTKLIGWLFPNEPFELYGRVASDVKNKATDRQRKMADIAFGPLPAIVVADNKKEEDSGDKEENNGAE